MYQILDFKNRTYFAFINIRITIKIRLESKKSNVHNCNCMLKSASEILNLLSGVISENVKFELFTVYKNAKLNKLKIITHPFWMINLHQRK